MIDKEILSQQVGRPLRAGKFESLQVDEESPDSINVTFLKFDENWLRIVTTDGQTKIMLIEPKDLVTSVEGRSFRYFQTSLEVLPGFTSYLGRRLVRFTELLSETSGQSFGVKLYFGGDESFIIRNHD